MATEILDQNPYLHWSKESLEDKLKELKKLRPLYLELGIDSKPFQDLVWEIKKVNASLGLHTPRLLYVQNEGKPNEAIYDLEKQEIRFTNYPELAITHVALVPNRESWKKIKMERKS